jgi:hypothetical protein
MSAIGGFSMLVAARSEETRLPDAESNGRSRNAQSFVAGERSSQALAREAAELDRQAKLARGISKVQRDNAGWSWAGAVAFGAMGQEFPAAVMGAEAVGAGIASNAASDKADDLEAQAQDKRAKAAEAKAAEEAAAQKASAERRAREQAQQEGDKREAASQIRELERMAREHDFHGNNYGGRASEERPDLRDRVSRTA